MGYTAINLGFLSAWGDNQNVNEPEDIAPADNWAAIGRDIPYCQGKNIKVLLSLTGGVNAGFTSTADARMTADKIWGYYLGGSLSGRPFGTAVLDGIEFHMSDGDGSYVADFIDKLNGYFKTANKEYWFTAAPQCAFPDAAMGSFLTSRGSFFKYLLVQFYDDPDCTGSQSLIVNSYSNNWSPFARKFNPQPKLIITLPASSADVIGFMDPGNAASTIRAAKTYGTLGASASGPSVLTARFIRG
eukprot:jgi/Botrbrau1/19514/Bobra.0035s0014.1